MSTIGTFSYGVVHRNLPFFKETNLCVSMGKLEYSHNKIYYISTGLKFEMKHKIPFYRINFLNYIWNY